MTRLAIAFVLFASACGSKQPAPETTPASTGDTAPPAPGPTDGGSAAGPMSPEECTAQGGTVKGDIGDGKVACDPDQRDLGRVNQGIEGAVCCAPGTGGTGAAP